MSEIPPYLEDISEVDPPRKRSRPWLWVLIAVGAFVFLGCGGGVALLVYFGLASPETSVYAGKQVPARFVETMRDVGALEPGENLLYFYSDALLDIRGGFYFVSDRKVVMYSNDQSDPLTVLTFGQIQDLELERDTSFFMDSQITLHLRDGTAVWFPVSSEFDRDVLFYEAIEERVKKDSDG